MSIFGIPYMGSKDSIVASLAMNFPKADHFYDLFGGGFSVSHYMLVNKSDRYKHFHYNEIKADIVDLVKRAISGDFSYSRFKPEWISKAEFDAKKDTDAYMRVCWSFGNDQRTYLFGPNIEPYKRSLHQAVVFDEFNEIATKTLGFDKWPAIAKTIKQRRLYLRQLIDHYRKTNTLPKILHQFLKPEQLQQLQQLERLQQLQQLQQLERLQQLEHLEQLQQLSFYCDDYRNIEILPKSVVYCDMPYLETKGYGEFDHKDFFQWAATRDFPVYISEYNISDSRFKLVYQISKRVLLSPDDKKIISNEKLYWNGVTNK